MPILFSPGCCCGRGCTPGMGADGCCTNRGDTLVVDFGAFGWTNLDEAYCTLCSSFGGEYTLTSPSAGCGGEEVAGYDNCGWGYTEEVDCQIKSPGHPCQEVRPITISVTAFIQSVDADHCKLVVQWHFCTGASNELCGICTSEFGRWEVQFDKGRDCRGEFTLSQVDASGDTDGKLTCPECIHGASVFPATITATIAA